MKNVDMKLRAEELENSKKLAEALTVCLPWIHAALEASGNFKDGITMEFGDFYNEAVEVAYDVGVEWKEDRSVPEFLEVIEDANWGMLSATIQNSMMDFLFGEMESIEYSTLESFKAFQMTRTPGGEIQLSSV